MLKYFNTLYESILYLIKESSTWSVKDFVESLRAFLLRNPDTAYAGQILQQMRIVVINDMYPKPVDYSDTSPDAYRPPIMEEVGWPSNEQPTMAVDAVGNLYLGEKWIVENLFKKYGPDVAREMIKAVLIHESMHISELTFFRGQGKNRKVWNIATDAYINLHIIRNNYPLPEDGIIPDKDGNIKIKLKRSPPSDVADTLVFNLNEKTSEVLYDEILTMFGNASEPDKPEGDGPPPPPRPIKHGDVVVYEDGEFGVVINHEKPYKVITITREEAEQKLKGREQPNRI